MTGFVALIGGGVLGTVARYAFAGLVYRTCGTGFPWGTLAVNLTGCFLIGLFAALSEVKFALGPSARMFLMVGFCGAYTTFSTLIFETANLVRDGQDILALANILTSVLVGFLIFRLGFFAGQLM